MGSEGFSYFLDSPPLFGLGISVCEPRDIEDDCHLKRARYTEWGTMVVRNISGTICALCYDGPGRSR